MQITCWKCGYDLRGMGVDDACPECGNPVWSTPPPDEAVADARSAMTWGIVSLVLFFACLGPIAGFLAIPAIVKANRVMKLYNTGKISENATRGARTGRTCGWISAGLSIAFTLVYAIFFGFAFLGVAGGLLTGVAGP
ncbi:MAG: hypothetical protein AAF235_10055 [Planctomycetota bacterium]